MVELNDELVEEILTVCKTVYDDIVYEKIGNNQYGFRIPIELSMSQLLEFNSTFNMITSGYTFALIYAGQRIAGFCAKPHKKHHNPTCNNIYGPHYHVWTSTQGDKYAEPLDIKGIEHPDVGIDWFMNRYNIYCIGRVYFPQSYQMEVKCYGQLSRNKR